MPESVTVSELIVPVCPETDIAAGYVDALAWVAVGPTGSGSTRPIEAVLEKVPDADAGDTSQTIGAAKSARATKIPKNFGSLPCSITEIPFTANESNLNSA